MTSFSARFRLTSAAVIVAALLLAPAPLLPPHRFAEAVQSVLPLEWKAAYLVAVVGLQFVFYGCLGVLASFSFRRAATLGGRILQVALVPPALIAFSLVIRSLKSGHLPVWVNAMIPIAGCVLGSSLGFGFLYRRGKIALASAVLIVGMLSWALLSGTSSELQLATYKHLQQIVTAGPTVPFGDQRFGALLQASFQPLPGGSSQLNAIRENRAAILAWGIAVGDARLARLSGLNPQSDVVRSATALGQNVMLHGRTDWSKHYAVSAALTVLEHPSISEAGGLMKEQLDALTGGSGFSFGDLAADRAGIRFAVASTTSEVAAKAMQLRMRGNLVTNDLFPPSLGLPESLTVEQFRKEFGAVGSERYSKEISIIDAQLDKCSALSVW